MVDTLLTIVQKAIGRIGSLDVPTAIVASQDEIVQTMLFLAQEEGEELVRAYGWSALTIEGATITLVAGQESYALPADFDRLVGDTQWDRTNRWRTMGPDDAQDARRRREGIVDNGPRRTLRQVGNSVTVWPVPGDGDAGSVLAYDYVSSAFCASSGGALQTAWAADTDVPILRADLMVLGLKWRWRFAKGLEASVLRRDYERAVQLAIARDQGGGQTINLAGRRRTEPGNCDGVYAAGPSVALTTDNGDTIAPD